MRYIVLWNFPLSFRLYFNNVIFYWGFISAWHYKHESVTSAHTSYLHFISRRGLEEWLSVWTLHYLGKYLMFVFFLLSGSLSKTTLDSAGCLEMHAKTLGSCLWVHCPTEKASNCFKSHQFLQLRYVGGSVKICFIMSSNAHIFKKRFSFSFNFFFSKTRFWT